MGKSKVVLLPQTQRILEQMGDQIRLARLRRDISVELAAERAGISRTTLWQIEKGSPSVAIGAYAAALHALNNMDKDLLLVAKDDELGRKLQDLGLETKRRASKKEDSDYKECKKAMSDFAEFVIINKIDSEKSEFVKIIKKDGKYIYEYYYEGNKIFYRQTVYDQLESCKKTIKSIYKNINEFIENDLEKKGKGDW